LAAQPGLIEYHKTRRSEESESVSTTINSFGKVFIRMPFLCDTLSVVSRFPSPLIYGIRMHVDIVENILVRIPVNSILCTSEYKVSLTH